MLSRDLTQCLINNFFSSGGGWFCVVYFCLELGGIFPMIAPFSLNLLLSFLLLCFSLWKPYNYFNRFIINTHDLDYATEQEKAEPLQEVTSVRHRWIFGEEDRSSKFIAHFMLLNQELRSTWGTHVTDWTSISNETIFWRKTRISNEKINAQKHWKVEDIWKKPVIFPMEKSTTFLVKAKAILMVNPANVICKLSTD